MLRLLSLVIVLEILTPQITSTRSLGQKATQGQPRSPVQLLPGYTLQMRAGFEGEIVGRIQKISGSIIEFNTGAYNGNAAQSVTEQDVLWREEQTVKDTRIICVYAKSHEFTITLLGTHPANFRAEPRTEQDITEMLLMALTFDPVNGYEIKEAAKGSPGG